MNKKALLLGNEAIAGAIVAAGCQVATAYPGTPSSEILPAIAKRADELEAEMVVEWGANEKVAFEMAVTSTFAGARACCVMKHVGLNVAADPFMTTALYELKGGMLLVSSDDPGPHSSQNEQDSRFFAMFAKVPCLDPADAEEAAAMVADGYSLSERHGVVTMLRPTTRISHSRQALDLPSSRAPAPKLPVAFERNPARWCPLPAIVRTSHPRHNARLLRIQEEFEHDWGRYNFEVKAQKPARLGVIASGIAFASLCDVLVEQGREDVDILKIGTPFPLPVKMADEFVARHDRILVLEESYPVIELQLTNRTRVMGRSNGFVPEAGELLPEVVADLLARALGEEPEAPDAEFVSLMDELRLAPRKPTLCAGCPHRSSFLSIRRALPSAINPSDIGCYTLGINQKGIDTSICMGGAVTSSSGLYLAHKVSGQSRPVVATIGDSTFYHMGVPGLLSAVYNRHSFVLCILDNSSTAMTGGQSHPGLGEKPRKEDEGVAVDLIKLCHGCGVEFVEVVPAYDNAAGVDAVKRAWQHAEAERKPAVVIFRHPCMLLRPKQDVIPVTVDPDKCVGCRYCIDYFGCPGLSFDERTKKTSIDPNYCISCGACRAACPHGAILEEKR